MFHRLLVVGLAVPAVQTADVIDFAVVLVQQFLDLAVVHLADLVVVVGGYAVGDKVPGSSVDEQFVRGLLFVQPFPDFLLLGGQVVPVVHNVTVEVRLVMESPARKEKRKEESQHQHRRGLFFGLGVGTEIFNQVGYRQRRQKSHAGNHHQAVALVDFDTEVAGHVFQDHVGLDMVQGEEYENFQIELVALAEIHDGAVDQV